MCIILHFLTRFHFASITKINLGKGIYDVRTFLFNQKNYLLEAYANFRK